jgi:uroporphyrinogen-III decarboxylase
MMSRTDFENLIYPFYQSAASTIKEKGFYAFFHSDGNIWNILGHLLDAEFDCLHCIDAQAGMDLHKLREVYADKIAFMGHIDLLAWDENRIELEVEQAEKEFVLGGVILGSSCGLSTLVPLNRLKALYKRWESIPMSI